jgi:MGT family glycosyltransferase
LKVVIFSWPHYSHTTATIPLVDELIEQGMEVFYFGEEQFGKLFQNKDVVFVPYSVDLDAVDALVEELVEKCQRLIPLINNKQSLINFRTSYVTSTISLQFMYFEDVIEKVKSIKPDLILRDSCSFFGKMVGSQLSTSVVGYLTNLTFSEDYVYSSPKNILSKLFNLDLGFLTDREAKEVFEELEKYHHSFSKSKGIPDVPVLYTYDPKESVNIVFGSPKLQPLLNLRKNRYLITKPPVVVKNQELYAEKRSKEKLVYVSTGSTFYAMDQFYNSIINAFKDSEYQVIMTIPLDKEELKFNKLPNNVVIESFVDQNEILSRASLFITHGGYNSICESIHHEVPIVVFPLSADQFINAHIVEELCIGKELHKKDLNSRSVGQLCESVIQNAEIKKNLGVIKESFKEALSIEEVVKEIIKIQ